MTRQFRLALLNRAFRDFQYTNDGSNLLQPLVGIGERCVNVGNSLVDLLLLRVQRGYHRLLEIGFNVLCASRASIVLLVELNAVVQVLDLAVQLTLHRFKVVLALVNRLLVINLAKVQFNLFAQDGNLFLKDSSLLLCFLDLVLIFLCQVILVLGALLHVFLVQGNALLDDGQLAFDLCQFLTTLRYLALEQGVHGAEDVDVKDRFHDSPALGSGQSHEWDIVCRAKDDDLTE